MRLERSDCAFHTRDGHCGAHDLTGRLMIGMAHAAVPCLPPGDHGVGAYARDHARDLIRRVRRVMHARIRKLEELHLRRTENAARLPRVLRAQLADLLGCAFTQRFRHLAVRQEQQHDAVAARRMRCDRAGAADFIVGMGEGYEKCLHVVVSSSPCCSSCMEFGHPTRRNRWITSRNDTI